MGTGQVGVQGKGGVAPAGSTWIKSSSPIARDPKGLQSIPKIKILLLKVVRFIFNYMNT